MIKLRSYQKEALEAIYANENDKGRIVIPTGGGKTLVESYALRTFINKDGRNIHLVLAPRIALVNQLIKEYRDFIGQNFIAVAFHSGRHEPDYQKVRWVERATTSSDLIVSEAARAKRLGKDLVVFSTYHSVAKLLQFKFDTLIADESQYCVTEGYFEIIRSLDATRKLFFTATEKHTPTDTGRGLNNEEVFGKILFQIAPKDLIKSGYIVPPRLHIMSATAKNNTYSTINEVIEISKKQIELTSHMPVTKILFAMKGTADVQEIAENIGKLKAELPNFRIFTIVSNAKYGSMIDGVKFPRGNFMKELRETDHALIFHYDILSEGIDIDGITGVVLLRNMTHSKLLQTIGRAVRQYKANPALKKEAWVSVVSINGNEESSSHLTRVVKLIREGGFDINVEQVTFTDNDGWGIGEGDDIPDLVDMDRRNKAKAELEQILHNIEEANEIELISTVDVEELRGIF